MMVRNARVGFRNWGLLFRVRNEGLLTCRNAGLYPFRRKCVSLGMRVQVLECRFSVQEQRLEPRRADLANRNADIVFVLKC